MQERVLAGRIERYRVARSRAGRVVERRVRAVEANSPLLAKIGLTVEPFGQGTMLVHSYPAMLRVRPAELRAKPPRRWRRWARLDLRDVLEHILATMACKAAVKAGDRLAPEEVAALLDQRHPRKTPTHCPHGRPTALVFTREELDRQFSRISNERRRAASHGRNNPPRNNAESQPQSGRIAARAANIRSDATEDFRGPRARPCAVDARVASWYEPGIPQMTPSSRRSFLARSTAGSRPHGRAGTARLGG